jgi:uncharacterized protein
MAFQLEDAEGRSVFTGYGEGYVSVNHQRYERHVVVSPERGVSDWGAESFESLTPAHFESLLELTPEIVILGTGDSLRFARPEITRPLAAARVGLETMDTKAACRTYNILTAEGRKVVAAIFVD